VNTYLALGDAFLADNDLEQATEAYRTAVSIDPKKAEPHSMLAYLYSKEGRVVEAISHTLRVLELSKNEQLLYNSYKNLALLYRQIDQSDQALAAAQQALIRAPEKEQAAVRGLIDQLEAGGAVSEADVTAQQLLAEGEAALNDGQWQRAEQAYKGALALNPDLVIAHSALSYIYAQQGRLEEAEQENQVVLSAIPGDLATLKNLAIIHREMKHYDDALQYAQLALDSPQATEEDRRLLQVFINEVESLRSAG
jgi:tetratricopeptide (TPR) repeat protein